MAKSDFAVHPVGDVNIKLNFAALALPSDVYPAGRCGIPTLCVAQRADKGRGDQNVVCVGNIGIGNNTCKVFDKPSRDIAEKVMIV